jgi:hypothetical protein
MFNDKIVALLAEADRDVLVEFFHGEVDESTRWDSEEMTEFRKALADADIRFEFVDRYGGEDQGSDYWSVYSFSDGMQVVFIQFDGWYASYQGSTYEEFFEVTPVEKTITVFEKK